MSAPGNGFRGDDAGVEKALDDALRGAPLDEVSLARMRSAVHAEWRASIEGHRPVASRRWPGVAAAALILVVLWAGWLAVRPTEVFGVLQGPPEARGQGDARLRVGAHMEARSSLLVSLQSGGLLRARAGSILELVGSGEVRLLRGAVYVDAQGRSPSTPIRVDTPAGVVRHSGTQFEVAMVGNQVRVRVREGSVSVRGDLRVTVGEQLTIGPGGAAQREPFAPYDSEWRWVEAAVVDVPVEGRSLASLLHWVARDTGRKLEFADVRSAAIADDTILHGSVAGLAPELALRAMLATTSLEADVQVDRIVVRARTPAPRG
jgi:ferric-dicitrate binding protein FerR (iron transport regulator)